MSTDKSRFPLIAHASDSEQILTSREAAKLLGISVSTAQSWMETGTLASWKTPGGHRRVKRSTVMQQLDRLSGITSQSTRNQLRVSDDEKVLEELRLGALEQSGLLTTPDDVFDRITWLATQITDAPIALMTLLTPTLQRFKSKHGIGIQETPREWAFCNYTILQDDIFTVTDASQDPRFKQNPLVLNQPHIRFYAGIALHDPNGFRLGALCVIDTEPRLLTRKQSRGLVELAALANLQIGAHSGADPA